MKRIFTFIIAFLMIASGAVWGQTTISGSHTTTITPSNGETITLNNANIDVSSGYALDMKDATTATLKIIGECTMTAKGGAAPAVYLPLGKTLTIMADEGSNAILRIKGNDNVQTVTDGEGKQKPKIGEIIVESGTVYILGNLRHDNGHATVQVQGGVAFIEGELPTKGDNTEGILFGKDGETWEGKLYEDYIINSNVQADIDGDPNTSDDIYLDLQEYTLTLGKGVVIDTRNDHFVVENGTIQAFTVTYNANPVTESDRTSTVPENPSYYGTEATIRLEAGITCTGANGSSVHEFLGWMKRGATDNIVHSAPNGTILTPASYTTGTTEQINIDAVWATKSITITVKEGEAIVSSDATALADTPDGSVTYNNGNLSGITSLPTGISFNGDKQLTGTPTVGNVTEGESKEFTTTVPYSYNLDGTTKTDKSTTITITVLKNKVTIDEDATIKFLDEDGNGIFLYDGQVHNTGNIQVIVDGVTLTEGIDFTVAYKYTSEDNKTQDQTDNVVVKNAGTYEIISINGKNNAEGTISNPTGEDGQPLKVVITPRKLKFQAVSRSISLDDAASYSLTPTLYDATNNQSGTIMLLSTTAEDNDGFATGEIPTSNWGSIFKGNLTTDPTPINKVGEYTLKAENVKITDASTFLTNNYEATFTDGKLTVNDTLGEDDVKTEIDNNDDESGSDAEFSNNTWTLTYDGKDHRITSVKTKDQPSVELSEDTDYEISYTYQATDNDEPTDVNLDESGTITNAGKYTVTISFKGNYSETADITQYIIIKKRPLTITASDQTIYVGTEDENKQTEVNKTPTFGQESGNTLTVTNIVTVDETAENVTFGTGELGLSDAANTAITNKTAGKISEAITQGNLALADDSNDADVNKNYTISTDDGATFTAGALTIIRVLGNDDKDNIKGGEDGDGDSEDGNFNGEGDYQLIGDGANVTYSGQPYEVKDLYLKVGENYEAIKNFTVTYAVKEGEGNTGSLNSDKKAVDAGKYTATIKVTSSTEEDGESYYETATDASLVFDFEIKPKEATVTGTYQCQIGADLSSGVNVSTLTLSSDDFVSGEEATYSGTIKLKEDKNTNTEGEQPDAFDCTNVIATAAEEGNAFKASNYDITYNISLVVGKITINPNPGEGEDGDDITGGEDNTKPDPDGDLEDEEDFIMISPEGEDAISVYDGKPHGLAILKIGDYTLYEGEENGDYTVEYEAQEGTKAVDTETGKPLHAGSYTATVTLNDDSKYQIKGKEGEYANKFTLTIQIKERPLEVYLNIPATIKENQNLEDLSSWWNSSKITFNEGGFANDTEKEKAIEKLSNAKVSISKLPNVGESADVKLMDIDFSDATPFFKSNYAITYYKGSTKVEGENVDLSDQDSDGTNDDASITDGTEVEDSDKITIDPTDPDTDITGGEDTDEDEDLDDKDYILVSTGDGNDVNAVYDGETHTIEYMVVTVDGKTYKLNATEDFTVSYTGEGLENGQPHDAGTYTASIEMIGKYTGNFDLNVTIKKRSLAVYFNFPLAIYDKNQISWSKDLITYKGLVEGETPAIPDECHLEVRGNRVWLVDFAFNDDPASEFETDNYIVNYQGNTGDITVNINEGTDDDHDGDIDVELPDGDIDLNPDDDPNHGGGDHGGSGINRPVHYYNIYVDTAATCDGVELSFSKEVVREGNQVSVYIDKILEGYNANDMKLWFKRSLFGYWEELEEGVQPGEYIIDHIYTDIYVKVTDVEHLPTGLEEVEGAKVYTQDGNIYVYTPSRMPVWIVSMTGALLRNEEQVGLQSYDRLTRGIYIVRVGEQVFKIQLK